MKVLIVYASKHGTTEKVAELLAESFEEHHVQNINIGKDAIPQLEDFDIILIGGSIHAGSIQGKIKKFYTRNMNILLSKKVGLFLCCMEKDKKAWDEFDMVYPEQLKKHAVAHGCLGGEFLFDNMNFFEKFMVKKISGHDQTISQIDFEGIKNFSDRIKKFLPLG